MSYFASIKFKDENGTPYGIKHIQNKPRVSAMTYLQDIAEGNVTNHTRWTKVGYAPSIGTGLSDIWGYSATQPIYIFPTAAQQMELVSSNAADLGTVIFSGTSTGGSTTTLIDTGKDFTAGTAVAVGDFVVLDKSGTTPEYGYVTGVSATTLTFSGGFSSGGTGTSRAYSVIDKSATTGIQAVRINYLDGNYAEKWEIVIMNGTGVVTTVNTDLFRVNTFRAVSVGSNEVAVGNISLRNLADTPVYSYILSGLTRARNCVYTVPAGKTLYVTSIMAAYAISGSPNKEYARITTKANVDPDTGFSTDGLFNAYTDTISQNNSVPVQLEMPTRLPEKTDIRVQSVASATGIASVTLRGWLETN